MSQSYTVATRKRAKRDVREEVNWQRVRKFLDFSMKAPTPVDEAFICTLNHLALSGFPRHEESAGFYRNTNVVVRDNGRTVFIPPGPERVPVLMRAFVLRINSPMPTFPVSPYVEQMARILLDFFEIHPFFEANGRTGRALVTFLMMREGFGERPETSLEEAFDSDFDGYFATLDQAHKRNLGPWLSYFSRAVEETMRPPP